MTYDNRAPLLSNREHLFTGNCLEDNCLILGKFSAVLCTTVPVMYTIISTHRAVLTGLLGLLVKFSFGKNCICFLAMSSLFLCWLFSVFLCTLSWLFFCLVVNTSSTVDCLDRFVSKMMWDVKLLLTQ